MAFLTVGTHRLEYTTVPGADPDAPWLVFLHEGLGSIGLWRDFPQKVALATGCPALVYSRYGYGRSTRLAEPRRPDYLHREALDVLPAVLDQFHIEAPILIGHSDGASIALIHAGQSGRAVCGIVAEAPHVFVEEITLAGIRAAVHTFSTTDLCRRLQRYHDDPENTFRGWSDVWLSNSFRDWNIEAALPGIGCPVLAIQGKNDEYGTEAQIDAIVRQVSGPAEKLMLPHCGHTPHRDQPERVLEAITDFVAGLR